VRVRSESTPSKPSSLVKDLDPAVERVILRCLEADPARRMSSALSVAAALPGGDPLAAALAAGETPSPQMVAAAGETTGLAPRTAIFCLAAAIVGLGLAVYLSVKTGAVGRLGLEQPPEVLRQKAKEIVNGLGYADKPVDSAADFAYDTDFVQYVEKHDKPQPRWDEVLSAEPAPLQYIYRQAAQYMVGSEIHDAFLTPGMVTDDDPPPILSGMINLALDSKGRLTFFQAIPPQVEKAGTHAATFDWYVLFHEAGLDPAQFKTTEPVWTSLATSDSRAAWTGTWPGSSRPLRIEAAAFAGKPVFFSMTGPWSRPLRMRPDPPTTAGQRARNFLLLAVILSVVAAAALLARRNYVRGRGDRRGALRLAYVVFATLMVLWVCRAHIVPTLDMTLPLVLAVSTALFASGLVWTLYLSLEPYVRRHWPQTLVSWSRLLMGQLRDPLVGRDVLFGVILGLIWIVIFQVRGLLTMRNGAPPEFYSTDYLMGGRHALGAWLLHIPGAIEGTLLFFFLLFVLRVLLRKEWLAAIVFVALWVALKTLGSDYPWIEAPAWTLLYGVAAFVVLRFGFVALAVGLFVTDMLLNVPLTLDLWAWYASTTLLPLAMVAALAVWGFYNSLAGQKLWKSEMFS
jgi:hypothetical protein